MRTIKVKQFEETKNQFVVETNEGEYFQSYDSVIVFIPRDGNEPVFLDINTWDYSKTTGKYRNIFLGEDKKETERNIKEGIYELVDLN